MKFIFIIPILLFYSLLSSCNESIEPISTIPVPTKGYTTPNVYPDMTSIWADDFNETSLKSTNWNFQIGNGCPNLCGWGNNEIQYYKQENVILQDGYLIIKAEEETIGTNKYSSSRINTQNKFSFHYGRIDVRAVLPVGQGIWPAIWMLGDDIETLGWPASGEIDIMEMIGGNGREKTIHGTAHWENNGSHAMLNGDYSLSSGTFNDEFHVFSIIWNAESIRWYINDIKYHEIDITQQDLNEFQKDFHFLINLAIGGDWPGNPDNTTNFPQYFIVDYIRVFQ